LIKPLQEELFLTLFEKNIKHQYFGIEKYLKSLLISRVEYSIELFQTSYEEGDFTKFDGTGGNQSSTTSLR
jgi:hypothetical protein